jgi:hypothetical protein
MGPLGGGLGLAYGLGLATALLVKKAGPTIGRYARPLARNVIKGSLVLGREAQRVTAEAYAELGDLTAEARSQLDAEGADVGNGRA